MLRLLQRINTGLSQSLRARYIEPKPFLLSCPLSPIPPPPCLLPHLVPAPPDPPLPSLCRLLPHAFLSPFFLPSFSPLAHSKLGTHRHSTHAPVCARLISVLSPSTQLSDVSFSCLFLCPNSQFYIVTSFLVPFPFIR